MNEKQRLAVEAPSGYVQIVAGPGTGKTTTIVHRALELLSRGVDPSRLLLLSFTRSAARELRVRISERLGEECPVLVGTFHSVAYRFLRKYDTHNSRGLAVIDDAERRELLGKLVDASKVANMLRQVSSIQAGGSGSDEAHEVYAKYKELLAALRRVDYDELLNVFHEHLVSSSRAADSLDAVLVDEFQDTSLIQLKITMRLASKCGNLTVVGDPDQSIYGFRNAQFLNFARMAEQVPSTKRFYLETNYRSSQPILNSAHSIISASERLEKCPPLQANVHLDMPVDFVLFPSETIEASAIASQVARLGKCGVQPGEVCILARKTSSFSAIESELLARGFHIRAVGGKKSVASKFVRGIVDYMRVALDNGDSLAVSRTINNPPRKIGPATVKRVSVNDMPQMQLIRAESGENFRAYASEIDQVSALLAGGDLKAVLSAIERCAAILGGSETSILVNTAQHMARIAAEEGLDDGLTFAQHFVSTWALNVGHSSEPDEDSITLSTIHSAKGLEWPIVFVAGLAADDKTNDLDEERRLLYVALTRAKFYLTVTSPSTKFSALLSAGDAGSSMRAVSRQHSELLSRALKRTISYRGPEKTSLGKAIELADGFMLASDLPLGPSSRDSTKRARPELAEAPSKSRDELAKGKRPVQSKEVKRSKPSLGTKSSAKGGSRPAKGILAYFKTC